jgi:hypothetical protein
MKERTNELIQQTKRRIYVEIIRPIRKWKKRRDYERRRESVQQAKGELLEQFEPMITKLMEETLADYHETCRQNHHTIQARHDIKRLWEIKVKGFITSQK